MSKIIKFQKPKDDKINFLLKNNETIKAITEYRIQTGCSLTAAHDYIKKLKSEMKQTNEKP